MTEVTVANWDLVRKYISPLKEKSRENLGTEKTKDRKREL